MGSFYANLTLRTDDATAVARALAELGRDAYVAPAESGAVVVFDRAAEEGPREVAQLAARLTRRLGCAGLAVIVADDDVLWYALHHRGDAVDEYDSCPGYGTRAEKAPSGGDARRLCAAFGAAGREEAVRVILHESAPTFETDRHGALVEALGLPPVAVGTGYGYVTHGEVQDVDPGALLRVGRAPYVGAM
jgi:hypothetical protein